MVDDSEKLREWAAAERFAVMAEEMVRTAMREQAERGGAGPSEEIQRIAVERRVAADALFHEIYSATKKGRNPSP